jgi:hypothetical protein
MKETMKRHISSVVLLAVFLPMLILSSIHVHHSVHQQEKECEECVHHIPHSGHIGVQTTCSFDCVLCQFLSLPFLMAAAVIFTARHHCSTISFSTKKQHTAKGTEGIICLRAPPFLR